MFWVLCVLFVFSSSFYGSGGLGARLVRQNKGNFIALGVSGRVPHGSGGLGARIVR